MYKMPLPNYQHKATALFSLAYVVGTDVTGGSWLLPIHVELASALRGETQQLLCGWVAGPRCKVSGQMYGRNVLQNQTTYSERWCYHILFKIESFTSLGTVNTVDNDAWEFASTSSLTKVWSDDPDVIWTRSLLIWSQTRYRCATESLGCCHMCKLLHDYPIYLVGV